MIDKLIFEIEKAIKSQRKYASSYSIQDNLFKLLVLKYYCDNDIFSYKEIISKKTLEEIPSPIEDKKIHDIENTHLLATIQYCDLKQIIKEYIKTQISDFIDWDKEKLYIVTDLNFENYDITGKTTYVIDQFYISKREIEKFKILDKILEINNKYVELKEVDIPKYNSIIIYENEPIYKVYRRENNEYMLIEDIINRTNTEVLLQTSFKRISNIKEARRTLKYLSYVVLYDDEKVFLNFKRKENDKISIIDYNKNKINSIEKLKRIIENNRKQEDVLVKVTEQDIRNNYYRIGFKLYQEGYEKKEININELAEDNAKMIEQLAILDKKIQAEINKLMK